MRPGGLPGEEALKDFSKWRWGRGEVLVEGTGCAKVWRLETGAHSISYCLFTVRHIYVQSARQLSEVVRSDPIPQGRKRCLKVRGLVTSGWHRR